MCGWSQPQPQDTFHAVRPYREREQITVNSCNRLSVAATVYIFSLLQIVRALEGQIFSDLVPHRSRSSITSGSPTSPDSIRSENVFPNKSAANPYPYFDWVIVYTNFIFSIPVLKRSPWRPWRFLFVVFWGVAWNLLTTTVSYLSHKNTRVLKYLMYQVICPPAVINLQLHFGGERKV